MSEDGSLDEDIKFRCTPRFKRRMKVAAGLEGKSNSAYIRGVLKEDFAKKGLDRLELDNRS